ncbi:glutathione S-transferase 3 [Aplysia californica]|uniref:Glutathione S-transferase 3 n=1 Tax=Aplysia californica TaxID=6500 RepID=A0ABM0K1P9_APLCA|nr:glutathione S-transferase 3 [Aplysia californica]
MSSSKAKIYYFDMMGRAEMTRLLFAAAGKPFEDIRFSEEDWPKFKPKAPFGTAPWVEVDGEVYAQSIAIANYFAKEFGFFGKNNKEALLVEQMVNLIQDFIQVTVLIDEEQDQKKKAEMLKDCKEKATPRYFGFFEKILKTTGTGYVVGNQLSLADIALYDVYTGWMKSFLGPVDDYPLCKALRDKVGANDKIKEYMAARPVRVG